MGKIFRCSVLTGAIMIIVSSYPTYLSNVYVSGRGKPDGYAGINLWRSFALPAGILIVSMCPLQPPNLMNFGQVVSEFAFHMMGALGAIILFLLCEFHDVNDSAIKIVGNEKTVRTALVWLTLISLIFFVICMAVQALNPLLDICCDDVYLTVNKTTIDAARINEASVQVLQSEYFQEMAHVRPEGKFNPMPLY